MSPCLVDEAGAVLLPRLEWARDIWGRTRGLMFRAVLAPDQGMLIEPCSSIHTCFMRFAIDVVYLSADHEVIRVVPALGPWRISLEPRARAVLELAAHRAAELGIAAGRRLRPE